jgi:alpha-glucosidase
MQLNKKSPEKITANSKLKIMGLLSTTRMLRTTTLLLLVALISGVSCSTKDREIGITSPDKHLSLSVFNTQEGRLSYTVMLDDVQVIETSPLGLTIDSLDLGVGAKIVSSITREIDEKYDMAGAHATAINRAREAIISMETSGKKFKLIVRVYNDGVAIRYTIPEGAKRINGESTSWNIPRNAAKIAWAEFSQSYEGLSHITSLLEIPEDTTLMPPLTVEGKGYYLSISEADCETFSDMAVVRKGSSFQATFPFAKGGWNISQRTDNAPGTLGGTYQGDNVSPWRTAIITKDLTGLVNSDLLTNLCPAPATGVDFSWVKPGRCLWQWWSVGEPKLEDQKDWYNAAAKLRWEYYLIDAGWREWKSPGKDQWQLLGEVIGYGKSVGVKSIVWVHSNEIPQGKERREYLQKLKAAGADGVKIDFVPDATSNIMQWYMGSLQDCAKLGLLVNFHGSVKPTGLRRTYPNDITREAVRGNEWHMTRYNRVAPPEEDVTLPFTRLMAGPADVTPVMLDPVQLKSSRFTWPREFAQAIVYLSPLTHFADRYKFYLESPMFDLFQEVPTVWDETKVLQCTSMGEVVAFARRKRNTWWIGAMNGAKETEIKISFDFLEKISRATLVYDDIRNFAGLDRREQTVSPGDTLTIKLAPAGGFIARLQY